MTRGSARLLIIGPVFPPVMGQTGAALRFHNATKHSEISLRTSAHYLDWNNKPSPFKFYKNLQAIHLPRDFPHPNEPALRAIRGAGSLDMIKPLDINHLTEILFFSAGLTRKMKFGGETYYMRAASATGALYPIELYLINNDAEGLGPGVYHFNALDFSLVRIREGNYSSVLADATDEETRSYAATIAMTSLAWRNAWKYEARSYRHWFWDAGVIAANLLAVCHSEHLPARLLMGFVDSDIDAVLGLTPAKEAAVALASIGKSHDRHATSTVQEIPSLNLETEPPSTDEVDYPIIWDTNSASALSNRSQVQSWHGSYHNNGSNRQQDMQATSTLAQRDGSPQLTQVILQRGSTRRFAQKPIQLEALSTILEASSGSVPLDFMSHDETLIDFYMIINEVDGLTPGSYYYDTRTRKLEQLKKGKLRYVSGYLSLEQLLFSDASVVFFLMTDLASVLDKLGDRGYRAAQFEAGIRAGKIYLSAYAQGIGASGSTFFDDAVTEFFSPHASKKSAMIVVGVGVPAYKARSGKILPQFHTQH